MATKDECSKFWANKSMFENVSRGISTNDKATQKKLADAETEYSQKCGMYNEKELNCIYINSRLQAQKSLLSASALSYFQNQSDAYNSSSAIARIQKEFNDNDCTKVIEQYRQQELGDVASKFSALDKARIEQESKYVRNQRIFFGGLVLLGGVVIITMFGKNK